MEEIDIFGLSGAGYDTSTGIFSPEGRIFAAEYAKKAVEQGETAIGILVEEGVVLLARKKLQPLHEPDSVEKISQVDEHVGTAASGFMADARRLISDARVKAQSYWLTFEERIPAEALADYVCDVKAQFTQGGGARPYGVALIIASVDYDGSPRLFVTDPVGTYWGFLAAVIGRGSVPAGDYLKENYRRDMALTDAITLAADALRHAGDADLSPETVEIAKIPVETTKFYKLTHSEIENFITPA